MSKLKILTYSMVGVALLLSITVFGQHRFSSPRKNPSTAETAKTFPRLGIEITTDATEKVLYIPVGLTAGKSPIAYVPVKNGGYVSAVRVAPVMVDGVVKVDISAVSGDFRISDSCEQLKRLPARLIGTHLANRGESITVQDNLSNAPWRVTVKPVELRASTLATQQATFMNRKIHSFQDGGSDSDHPCGCASCGGPEHPLLCCPNLGKCLECSTCGKVCCPAGELE